MNAIMPVTPMPAKTTADENQQPLIADGEVCLEQQMAELGLSNDTRRFLRDLHTAEKQLNDAFDEAHQGGELGQRVSQVYRKMYRVG